GFTGCRGEDPLDEYQLPAVAELLVVDAGVVGRRAGAAAAVVVAPGQLQVEVAVILAGGLVQAGVERVGRAAVDRRKEPAYQQVPVGRQQHGVHRVVGLVAPGRFHRTARRVDLGQVVCG